jgi:hypothetical protein
VKPREQTLQVPETSTKVKLKLLSLSSALFLTDSLRRSQTCRRWACDVASSLPAPGSSPSTSTSRAMSSRSSAEVSAPPSRSFASPRAGAPEPRHRARPARALFARLAGSFADPPSPPPHAPPPPPPAAEHAPSPAPLFELALKCVPPPPPRASRSPPADPRGRRLGAPPRRLIPRTPRRPSPTADPKPSSLPSRAPLRASSRVRVRSFITAGKPRASTTASFASAATVGACSARSPSAWRT